MRKGENTFQKEGVSKVQLLIGIQNAFGQIVKGVCIGHQARFLNIGGSLKCSTYSAPIHGIISMPHSCVKPRTDFLWLRGYKLIHSSQDSCGQEARQVGPASYSSSNFHIYLGESRLPQDRKQGQITLRAEVLSDNPPILMFRLCCKLNGHSVHLSLLSF